MPAGACSTVPRVLTAEAGRIHEGRRREGLRLVAAAAGGGWWAWDLGHAAGRGEAQGSPALLTSLARLRASVFFFSCTRMRCWSQAISLTSSSLKGHWLGQPRVLCLRLARIALLLALYAVVLQHLALDLVLLLQ